MPTPAARKCPQVKAASQFVRNQSGVSREHISCPFISVRPFLRRTVDLNEKTHLHVCAQTGRCRRRSPNFFHVVYRPYARQAPRGVSRQRVPADRAFIRHHLRRYVPVASCASPQSVHFFVDARGRRGRIWLRRVPRMSWPARDGKRSTASQAGRGRGTNLLFACTPRPLWGRIERRIPPVCRAPRTTTPCEPRQS